MPTLDIVRCALTLDTTQPIYQYGWIVRSVVTWYCLPFRSPDEREQVVHQLADHMADVTAPMTASEVDALTALLCLSRDADEAAYNSAVASLEREFAQVLSTESLGNLNDVVDRLLAVARDDCREVGQWATPMASSHSEATLQPYVP